MFLTRVRHSKGGQSFETEVFWVGMEQMSRWSVSALAPAFSSVLVSLEGLSSAQSQHKVLGGVTGGEFPLHGPCSKPVAWLLFARMLNCPKGVMSVQGAGPAQHRAVIVLLSKCRG